MPISADKDYSLGRRHRGRLQNDHWTTTQALRNALDRPRRQRYHRAALLPDEWPLGGILGDALGQDQLTPTNLSHTFGALGSALYYSQCSVVSKSRCPLLLAR